SVQPYPHRRTLHSFPTRRSSDLLPAAEPDRSQVHLFTWNLANPFEAYPSTEDRNPRRAVSTASENWSKSPGISCFRQPIKEKSTDRKSTRLNSSHGSISYAVFCL